MKHKNQEATETNKQPILYIKSLLFKPALCNLGTGPEVSELGVGSTDADILLCAASTFSLFSSQAHRFEGQGDHYHHLQSTNAGALLSNSCNLYLLCNGRALKIQVKYRLFGIRVRKESKSFG